MHAARDDTWKWWWLAAVGGLALIMLLGSLVLGGCEDGRQNGHHDVTSRSENRPTQEPSPQSASSQATTNQAAADETPGPSTKTAVPVAKVTGEEATLDLGDISPNSTHRMAFDVVNTTDTDLKVESIQSDCKCISAVSPPQTLPAGQTTRINVVYEAPEAALPYKTRLTVVTDSGERRFISLWVKSRSVR